MRTSIHDLILLLMGMILLSFIMVISLPLPLWGTLLFILELTALLFVLSWLWKLKMDVNRILAFCHKVEEGQYDCKPIPLSRNDEIQDLNQEVASMKNYLQTMHDAKSTMIQNISHNLKTPLSVIMLSCEMLLDKDIPAEQAEPYYHQIYSVSEKMLNDIQRLLELNRINHLISINESSNETTNMKDLIEHKVEEMNKLIQKNNLEVELVVYPVTYFGKEAYWSDILDNLLDNAIRYAKHTIKIKCYPKSLTVYNDGSKISAKLLPHLFDPYVKGEQGKNGLGLAIVQSIANLYGYQVTAENVSSGVEFKITEKEKE